MKPLYIPYISNSHLTNENGLERITDQSIGNQLSYAKFNIEYGKDTKVIEIYIHTRINELIEKAAEVFLVDKKQMLLTTKDTEALSCQRIVKDVIERHGKTLKMIRRDTVGAEENDMVVDNRSGNTGRRNQRRKIDLYSKHKFNIDLGFSTDKELYETLMVGGDIEKDTPRHVTIVDVGGEKKFSKHSKEIIKVVLQRYLGIQSDNPGLIPKVSVWNGGHQVEVNVEVKTDAHAHTLLNTTEIFGVPVNIKPHKFRNHTVTKVWDSEGIFATFSDEELAKVMEHKAVVKVQREEYFDQATKTKLPGRSYKVTFEKRVRPKLLQFPGFGVEYVTELHVPKPTMCYHCQQIGHYEDRCPEAEKPKVCYRCGERHSTEITCERAARCVNCKGSHPASYKGCPAYKQEEIIKKKAVEDRVTPWEVIKNMKATGLYVNYKNTTAQQVRATINSQKERDDEVQKELKEIKQMILHQVTIRDENEETGDNTTELESLRRENVKLKAENERFVNIEQENQKLKEDIRSIREDLAQMRNEKEPIGNREVSQLRQELKQMKDNYEALLQANKNDPQQSSILTKFNELVQANAQKDKTIADLQKSKVNNTAASNTDDLELLKTEYEMRMNLASKTIEERDARIRELQIKLSDKSRDPRFNPPTQPKKSPQRSRSNQRSGGGSYKQSH